MSFQKPECTCSPKHIEAGGYDRGCPVHDTAGVTHACPGKGESVTPCCGYTPQELPRADRLTADLGLVTCPVATSPAPADEREALTTALYADADLGPGYMLHGDCEHLAARILASDWLAAHDADLRARVAGEIAERIEADYGPTVRDCEGHGRAWLVARAYRRAASIARAAAEGAES